MIQSLHQYLLVYWFSINKFLKKMSTELKIKVVHLSNDENEQENDVYLSYTKDLKGFKKVYGDNIPMLIFKEGDVICEDDPNEAYVDAWYFDNGENPTKVLCNMDIVKSELIERFRVLRNAFLEGWDHHHQIAMFKSQTDEVERINAIKEKLRQCINTFEQAITECNTLWELRQIQPVEFQTCRPPGWEGAGLVSVSPTPRMMKTL